MVWASQSLLRNTEISQDPEIIFDAKGDNSFLEMVNRATKSKAFNELLTDLSNRHKDQFFDACEGGDLETVGVVLPSIFGTNLYEGIRKAIKTRRLRIIEYILDQKANEDRNLFCNIWSSLAKLSPQDPIIELVLRKQKTFNEGLTFACEAGNVALVQHLLDKGADDYQMGLNKSVRGNCLELVKKFVEVAASKSVKLDIDEATRWIPFNDADPDMLEYLEKLSPGCCIAGMSNVMNQLFGCPVSEGTNESFRKMTAQISEISSLEHIDERVSEATKVLNEFSAGASDATQDVLNTIINKLKEIAELPEDQRQEQVTNTLQKLMKDMF